MSAFQWEHRAMTLGQALAVESGKRMTAERALWRIVALPVPDAVKAIEIADVALSELRTLSPADPGDPAPGVPLGEPRPGAGRSEKGLQDATEGVNR